MKRYDIDYYNMRIFQTYYHIFRLIKIKNKKNQMYSIHIAHLTETLVWDCSHISI